LKELVRKSSVLFELHMVSAVSIGIKLLMTHNLPKDYTMIDSMPISLNYIEKNAI